MKRRPPSTRCGLLAGVALLAGCSGLFRSTAPPEQTYYLRPPAVPAAAPAGADAGAASDGAAAQPALVSLRVIHPVAAPGLDSPHIILIQANHRMNFYAGSRWPAPVTDMVGALALETLRGSGAWASLEDPASPFPSDYLLQIAVRRFEADYTAGGAAPVVYVMLECAVGRREGREVVATFTAAGSARATANRLGEVVAAFEQAAGEALTSLSQQAGQAVRAARASAEAHRAAQNGVNPLPSSSR
ncbi:MAG TPA: ABC-type transport auxiliary lipoprotein family protein [Steroidobacteraceae bacterium]|nr:ABC-type transport auxiliary lipoprotein family protein [Steroidobacteraceae bacterium]